jgi:RNA polymerase sigma-70 factor (ECF subfamily)
VIDAPNASVATDAADDLQIVARAQSDPNAFAPLYLRYEPIVRGYCQRRLGNLEVAEDATSQIFIRALNALPSFRPDASRPGSTFRAWLFTIAHNIVIDTHRRDRHHHSLDFPSHHGGPPISESIAAIDPSRSPEDLAIANDLRRQVQETLAALPERQRQIVELRLADLTGSEIAESLGMSVSAVKSVQFRAYTTLRDLLDHPTRRTPQEEIPDAS